MGTEPRDLVVVMAGDRSLHESFVADRAFDLWVVYYGDSEEVAQRYSAGADRFWRRKGLKIDLIRQVLLEEVCLGEGQDYSQYRYVFLPDDDIHFEAGAADLHKLFAMAAELEADAFQPAVKNDNVSFSATRQMAGVVCHHVNWVENMMPGYRSDIFRTAFLAGVHALEYMKSGWGSEIMAIKLAEVMLGRGVRSYVIDACPAVHTRPVGANSAVHEIGRDEEFLFPQLTTNQLKAYTAFRTTAAAREHMAGVRPQPRNRLAIELYMQKTRFARKLWRNLAEK
ncbi:hypothetical protein LJR225_004115 [Phenylobacterium sp. LjRoot225]|uniref:hypothetical protein n=1 Tax=Phenylobacterium sp. LjRoot225 TaxID=3342285 RepID=UPI003ECEA61E